MRASSRRLCQLVHDVGPRPGAKDRLQAVFGTACVIAYTDATFASTLHNMIIVTIVKLTALKRLVDNIAILLHPVRPGSSLPATLIGLHGENLFQALVAMRLPANVTKNVHLDVALAVRRLAQQEFINLHIHVYEQVAYVVLYKASEDTTTLAFLYRLDALDIFVEKHIDVAEKSIARQPGVGGPTH